MRGIENRDVARFIRSNVRAPDEVIGDIYAQISAGEIGANRLRQLLGEFELGDIEGLSDEIITRSERAMREAIGLFPAGRFEFACMNDGFDEPIRLEVAIERRGENIVVDFAGTASALPRGINVPLAYTTAYSSYAIKCIVAPDVPNNEGSLLPIQVTAPDGSILNPRHPAPTAARHILGHFLPSVIFGALEKAFPDGFPPTVPRVYGSRNSLVADATGGTSRSPSSHVAEWARVQRRMVFRSRHSLPGSRTSPRR